jgi:hypothetical protein
MRPLLSFAILFWCTTSAVFPQEIKLNVISVNPCNSTYNKEILVELIRDGKVFQISDTLGTFVLPDTGKYELKAFDSDLYRLLNTTKGITINPGQNYDTLTNATIVKCVGTLHEPDCGYFCCDKPCEGYKVDYFDSGNKKIEGHFKAGYPVGQLTFYYPDGRRKEIHYYDKGGKGELVKKEKY